MSDPAAMRLGLPATGLCLSLGLGLAAPAIAEETPDALPRLALAADATSVIGVSSGGYMATQLAVAWPARFQGLGVLAAGPWACARGSLSLALGQCMGTHKGPPDLNVLAERYRDYRERDLVGEAEALADLRVFIWQGGEDETVAPALGQALAEQFRGWLAAPDEQLNLVESEQAGHGWPVAADTQAPVEALADCRQGGATHLLACDRDIAGEALAWLHGELAPPEAPDRAGRLIAFDQADFEARGLADRGYLYVPEQCEAGGCDLTVALHGCAMGAEQIGETFVRHGGLNEWAAANERVVLYPQAETSLPNPQGCWDWWGFAESAWQLDPLHDTREGTQTSALMAMIERLQAAPETP
ncbi:alpha/beta hydrolase-fold protein [Halomonas denitrificans]|uniref:alpha/beta hydrolase-fold protein n=1 Tax=Halomonas denitrificans TaxID=370769 RepID=UPI001FEAFEB2|nr:alpha/beta hydrolase-fold protein [Halomonas denitrificans]